MDYIRSAVKALFYDYPVDAAIDSISRGEPIPTSLFSRIVNIRERVYTQATTDALNKKLRQSWMGGGVPLNGKEEMASVLQLPYHYADEVMQIDDAGNLKVDYEHLFKWNEMARYVGEELMTINYLAKVDYTVGFERTIFTWNSVLPHNNEKLYKTLRKDGGLCDIHMHFGATTDVFQLSWVSLMNNLQGNKQRFVLLTHPLGNPIVVNRGYSFDNLYRWCVLAGMIRWELFKYYLWGDKLSFGIRFDDDFRHMSQQNPMFYTRFIQDLQCLLTDAGRQSLKTSDNRILDYAILAQNVSKDSESSPFMVYHGERCVLYRFYKDYWSGTERSRGIAKFVFLYELIKNQFRRELVQVNEQIGLGNFQEFNGRKSIFVPSELNLVSKRHAVQTSITDEHDGMETRISPQKTVRNYQQLINATYEGHIFGGGEYTTGESLKKRMTFVVHFIKEKCESDNRYAKLRFNIKQKAELLIEGVFKEEERRGIAHRVVGVDAAGCETNCRPEVFAHLYRYCKKSGMINLTYHAGEDFYDVTEGLRSIEEAVRFLKLEKGNRLGHCLALGVNAKKYYAQRHGRILMPRQILLDNLVWLVKQTERFHIGIEKGIKGPILEEIYKLYGEIGYHLPFDLNSYYRSMLLRGDDLDEYKSGFSNWLTTAIDDSLLATEARMDNNSQQLCFEYFNDRTVYINGFKQAEEFKAPFRYDVLIRKLQNKMMDWISRIGICIETNPTSNIRIGGIDRYDEHPIYRFTKVRWLKRKNIIVTVNTDDKGIFSTSLEREFSLLACALTKQRVRGVRCKWTDGEIYNYVGRLASAGQINRFRL